MKLIVGLGNPGNKYKETRHNAGFMFLDALREKFLYQKDIQVSDWKKEDMFQSDLCIVRSGSKIMAMLQKPLTHMNNSGEAVSKLITKYEIGDIDDHMILVHDDLDIPLGSFKIQVGKSPEGHNGVKSVEDRLSGTQFKRVRIGVEARDNRNIPGEDYVLQNFSEDERQILDETIQDAVGGILADILM